jgi:hypothetical protein
VLLQTATIAAVLAPRPGTDARRRLLDEELIEPPLLKVREDHDLGEALCGNQPVRRVHPTILHQVISRQ